MTNSAITSYAILKVNWEQPEPRDYLDNYVLIIAETIHQLPDDIITLSEVQKQLRRSFGLEIPQNTISSLLKRVKKQGYIKVSDGTYRRVDSALAKLNFHEIQHRVLQAHETLLEGLVEFATRNYGTVWTADDAEKILQTSLQEHQITIPVGMISSLEVDLDVTQDKKNQYIVGKYVESLRKSQSSNLDYLETVIKGNLLANAIFMTDPGTYQRKFKETDIFLDTSLVMFALGYAGEPRKWPVIELIDLLKMHGAHIKIFRHSLEEIIGILSACAECIRSNQLQDSYGPSIEYFIEKGYSEVDIMMFIENLGADLLNLNILIVDKPPYIEYEHVIDEKAYSEYLSSKIDYSKERPLERDKDSITAILRLRRGEVFIAIEECKAIFVTTNRDLAYSTRGYSEFNYQTGTAPLAVTDYEITNLIWLKDPITASGLPRKRLIADCYAAIQPNDALWAKYLKAIDQLEKQNKITSDQYFILRHSIQAKSELMDCTFGEEKVFSDGTISEILACVEEKLRAVDVARANAEEQEKLEALSKLEKERESHAKQEERERRKEEKRKQLIKQKAAKVSKAICISVMVFLILSLGYLIYAISTIGPLNTGSNDKISAEVQVSSLLIFWLLLVLQTTNLVTGIMPKMLLDRWLEPKLTDLIERFMTVD